MAGSVAEFARDPILAELRAARDVVANPDVAFDFARHDGGGILARAEEVVFFRDDAEADDVVFQRDIPKPAAPANIGDGGVSLVNAGVAFRAAPVAPDGEFVELRVALIPAVAQCGDAVAARAIHGDGCVDVEGFAVRADGLDADDAARIIAQ